MFGEWNRNVSFCMTAMKSLHVVDSCVLLVALSLYAVYIRILYTNKVIHVNLKLILTAISTLDVAVLLVRIVDFVDFSDHYDFGPTTQNSIKMIAFSMGMISLYNLLAERIFALYANQWYDRPESARPHTIIMIYLLQFIVVLVAFRMGQNGGPTAAQIYVAVLFCCATVALVGTFVYMRIARQRQNFVMNRRFELAHHSVSGQYQMVENKRCERFIVLYIPYQVLSFFFTTVLGGILIFQVKDPPMFQLCQSLLYLTMTPRVIISMLIPVIRHPGLYKPFRHIFSRKRKTECVEHIELPSVDEPKYIIVRSSGGQQLTFSPEQESDLYFENYTMIWECTAEWNRMSK